MSASRRQSAASRLIISLLAFLIFLPAHPFESIYLHPTSALENDTFTLPVNARELTVRVRFADHRMVKKNKPALSLAFIGTDTLTLALSPTSADVTGVERIDAMRVDARINNHLFDSWVTERDINNQGGENMLNINLVGSLLEVAIGCEAMPKPHRLPLLENTDFSELRVIPNAGDRLEISELTITTPESIHKDLYGASIEFSTYNPDNLPDNGYPLEGYWSVYDYDLEGEFVSLSEDYEFYIAGRRENDDAPIEYDLIYLDGGPKGSRLAPGAVKAHMRDSRFPGVWEVVWVAADGTQLHRGIRMTLTEEQILNFRFAPQNSSFRLRRIQAEK